jgi:hypothetical protein
LATYLWLAAFGSVLQAARKINSVAKTKPVVFT